MPLHEEGFCEAADVVLVLLDPVCAPVRDHVESRLTGKLPSLVAAATDDGVHFAPALDELGDEAFDVDLVEPAGAAIPLIEVLGGPMEDCPAGVVPARGPPLVRDDLVGDAADVLEELQLLRVRVCLASSLFAARARPAAAARAARAGVVGAAGRTCGLRILAGALLALAAGVAARAPLRLALASLAAARALVGMAIRTDLLALALAAGVAARAFNAWGRRRAHNYKFNVPLRDAYLNKSNRMDASRNRAFRAPGRPDRQRRGSQTASARPENTSIFPV